MSTGLHHNYFEELLKCGLDHKLKEELTENFVRDKVSQFEKDLRQTIKPMVEQITVEKIETFRDHLKMMDEVSVFFGWKEVNKDASN